MQRAVAAAFLPPKFLPERGKYTWLYDLGKPLHEGRPAPLLSEELNVDTTLRQRNFGERPPYCNCPSHKTAQGGACVVVGHSFEGHRTNQVLACGGGKGD